MFVIDLFQYVYIFYQMFFVDKKNPPNQYIDIC